MQTIDKRDTHPRAETELALAKVVPESRTSVLLCVGPTKKRPYELLRLLDSQSLQAFFNSAQRKTPPVNFCFVLDDVRKKRTAASIFISLFRSRALSLFLSFAINALSLSIILQRQYINFYIYIFIYIYNILFSHIYIHFVFYINNSVLDTFFCSLTSQVCNIGIFFFFHHLFTDTYMYISKCGNERVLSKQPFSVLSSVSCSAFIFFSPYALFPLPT